MKFLHVYYFVLKDLPVCKIYSLYVTSPKDVPSAVDSGVDTGEG